MKWIEMLSRIKDEPVFSTGFLLTGGEDPRDVMKQLSRWTRAGKLYQLRRGLYALAPPFQKVQPHSFMVANRLNQPSYISLQSALSYYGMIPEYVPETTSITLGRPERLFTPLGRYSFRHIKKAFYYGFQQENLVRNQQAFIATPEKCLLDLLYLTPDSDNPDYIRELRLQNLEIVDKSKLNEYTERSGSKKIANGLKTVFELILEEEDYEVF